MKTNPKLNSIDISKLDFSRTVNSIAKELGIPGSTFIRFLKCNNIHDKFALTGKSGSGWNKGLTAKTSETIKKSSEILRGRYARGEILPSFLGKKHSAKTKRKISKTRTNYLKENPDKVPYRLNHYSKGPSYPELYFIQLFKNENLQFEYDVQYGIYRLDFVNFENKLIIEIDGEQHYLDNRILKSNKKRDNFFKSLGFNTIRIRWSEWQKKSENYKQKQISKLRFLLS